MEIVYGKCPRYFRWKTSIKFKWWFSPGTLVSSTNKTDRQDIAEILLKVVLNTIIHNSPIFTRNNCSHFTAR
jgi:hypothetical protein